MSASFIVAPVFESAGSVSDLAVRRLLNGKHPAAHTGDSTEAVLLSEEYLRTVQSCRECHPAMAQNVARTLAAAAFAHRKKHHDNVECRLASVNGVLHAAGDRTSSGSAMVRTVWQHVESYFAVESPVIEAHALCVREEIERLLELCPPEASLILITHAHQRKQVQVLLEEQGAASAASVFTPREIMDRITYGDYGRYAFVQEVVRAAEPTKEQNKQWQRWNAVLAEPFHHVSRMVEKWTFAQLKPEIVLAHLLHRRAPQPERAEIR